MNQTTAERSLDDLSQEFSTPDQKIATQSPSDRENLGAEPLAPLADALTEPQLDTKAAEASPLQSAAAQSLDPPYQESETVESADGESNLDLIMKIPVDVQVILGTTRMPVSKLMKLGRNAVIALDRQVGDPIDVVVNGRIVARGEVVLMEDDNSRFGISITEIVGPNASSE